MAFAVAGCFGSNPGTETNVRRYEHWLQGKPVYSESMTSSHVDVVFETDFRKVPEQGLSMVHLKETPALTGYIYDDNAGYIISPVFSEGVANVGIPFGRWTYIDRSGRFLFPPLFGKANAFDRGVATALLSHPSGGLRLVRAGGWVLLRRTGAMKELDPSIADIRDYSGDFAMYSTTRRLRGYIDHAGATRIPAAYSFARSFCADGNATVLSGSQWGLIDKSGKFVVQPRFADIHCFSQGIAAAKRGGIWGFIDRTGAFVIQPRFDDVGDFSEGLALFELRTFPYGKPFPFVRSYGFIDGAGAVVIPAIYASAYPFRFGVAKVGTMETDWLIYPLSFVVPASPYYTAWKYIDARGHVVASGGRS